jgi:F420H(2)-dependent quinone reductase
MWLWKAFMAFHVLMYRLSKGRLMNNVRGGPVLLLTTTGRKTGKRRTTPLVYVANQGGYLIMGSGGGSAKDPAWFSNLAANPTTQIEVGDETLKVRADVLKGAERDQAWAKVIGVMPFFADYEQQTSRQIPVVRLNPAG